MISSIDGQNLQMNSMAAGMTSRVNGAARTYQALSKPGATSGTKSSLTLSEEDKKKVDELKKRDLEVRAHEQAHKSVGGQYVSGGASFTYETGPDGKRYAIGGEVQIDVSKVQDDPDATIRKMQQVRKAALAPASPSGQDRKVAAMASRLEVEAMQERNSSKQQGTGKAKSGQHTINAKPTTYGSNFSFTQQNTTGQNLNIMA
jgi:hypothetical protein